MTSYASSSTRPLNIYALSRIHEEKPFRISEHHRSGKEGISNTKIHEIESLRFLADGLKTAGVTVEEMDGFYFSFHIPQIGKEFDLLKINQLNCLNIELKSIAVPRDQILIQLQKNRHYLSHLGKKLLLFTVVTDSLTCYRLTLENELREVEFSEVVQAVKSTARNYIQNIDSLFRASDYLVSPFNTPDRFIQEEYFLTQVQEQVKKSVLASVESAKGGEFFHITGQPGTGKTLVLYDIARTLAKHGKTLIIHCGELTPAQHKIAAAIYHLTFCSSQQLKETPEVLSDCSYLLADEAHRMDPEQFRIICASVQRNAQVCIFSTNPELVLTTSEKKNDIVSKIKGLDLVGEFELYEKFRFNKELRAFILCLKNLKNRKNFRTDYPNVEINCANTTQEAQNLLEYYRDKGYTFINYAVSEYEQSPYAEYEESFDSHHIIGQEYDRVVMVMDRSFYYDEDGILQGIPHPDPDYLYPNLFYLGITRVREQIALIIVNAPELFEKIISIAAPLPQESEEPAA